MKRRILCLTAALLFLLPAANASAADLWGGLGAHFTWNNYSTPIMLHDGAAPQIDTNKFSGPRFGGKFYLGLSKKFALSLSIDFNVFKMDIFPYADTETIADEDTSPKASAQFFTLGGLLGVKYYFMEPGEKKAVLYLSADVGGYVSKGKATYDEPQRGELSDDDIEMLDYKQGILQAQVDMIGNLAAPFVFQLALGAEFWAADSFSIGADVLGIRMAYSSADEGMVDRATLENSTYTGEASVLNVGIYSALTMTFNLSAGRQSKKSVSTDEEDWGQPAEGEKKPEDKDAWGTGASWGNTPAQPVPAQPAPAQPVPAQPAPAQPAPAQPGGWDNSTPPPPPPPPPPGY